VPVWAREAGSVTAIDVRAIGIAIVTLGGGRARETDRVDHSVGLTEVTALGDHVGPGERPLAMLHARDHDGALVAADALRAAYTLGERAGAVPGPVLEILRS
jgi:thymidine phosphorylase